MIPHNYDEKGTRKQLSTDGSSQQWGNSKCSKDYCCLVIKWLVVLMTIFLRVQTSSAVRVAGLGAMGREHMAEMLDNHQNTYSSHDEEMSSEDWEKLASLSAEKQLISKLLQKYDQQGKMGRPVIYTNDKLTVHFGLSLIQIMDVDESNQVLKLSLWYRYEWTDILLRWSPSLHENINSIRIPSAKIWLPDILLYNFADDRLNEQRDALVIVHSNGTIQWWPQAILRSSCSFDTKYFPFDVQHCYLKFGSWAYNGNKLNVEFVGEQAFDLSDYVMNSEWHVIGNNATRNVEYYTCCPEPYPDVTYELTIKRKTAFYTFILILPCILLSLLTLVIFWVPPESPAKLQLGMSVFVAFFLLLLVLADFVPRAAPSIPLIGAYFCLSMVMITLSTVLSCVVSNMYYRGVRIQRAPAWMRSCIGSSLAKAFGLDTPKPMTLEESLSQTKWPNNKRYSDSTLEIDKVPVRLCENGHHSNQRQNQNHSRYHYHNPQPHRNQQQQQQQQQQHSNYDSDETAVDRDLSYGMLPDRGSSYSALLQEVRAIRDSLSLADLKQRRREERNKMLQEWRILACITDRIFFAAYLLINVVTIAVLFTAI